MYLKGGGGEGLDFIFFFGVYIFDIYKMKFIFSGLFSFIVFKYSV